jgi:hypothetical protein
MGNVKDCAIRARSFLSADANNPPHRPTSMNQPHHPTAGATPHPHTP